jgi:hypothetical protein
MALHTVALGTKSSGQALKTWSHGQSFIKLVAKTLYKTWDYALNVCHQSYIIFLAVFFQVQNDLLLQQ